MADWYYEDNGAPRGPIPADDLRTMLANRFLHADTRVWTASFGQNWLPASQTELRPVTAPAGPPPFAAPFAAPAAPPPNFGRVTQPLAANTPYGQPIAGYRHGTFAAATAPNQTYANIIAFMPLIVLLIDIMLVVGGGVSIDSPQVHGVSFWIFILSLWIAYKDATVLQQAGLNPQNRSSVWFMFLTPIGYFLRRRAISGTSLAPMWIWVGCLLLYGFTLALVTE